jgi:hypothetical protein
MKSIQRRPNPMPFRFLDKAISPLSICIRSFRKMQGKEVFLQIPYNLLSFSLKPFGNLDIDEVNRKVKVRTL